MVRSLLPERALPRAGAGAVLGVLHAASFVPPLNYWWLQIGALALLIALTVGTGERAPRHRTLGVAAFGFAWFASGLAWLHTSMHVYGGMPWIIAAAAVALFSAYLTLFPLLAFAVARRLVGGARPVRRTAHGAFAALAGPAHPIAHSLALAGCWGLTEMLRGYLFTGFPWLATGYAHVDGPLAGFAPWLGVYGIGAIAALVAALAAGALRFGAARDVALARTPAALALGVLLAGFAIGRIQSTSADGPPVAVRLAQGNVPQQLKFDRDRAHAAMHEYTEMVEHSSAALVVLPETAWTVPWDATPPDLVQRILRPGDTRTAAVAIGMPLPQRDALSGAVARYTNSVALIRTGIGADPARIAARYDKRHLVPFGEFIPTGFAWFVALMQIPLGEFGRGAAGQPPFEVAGQRFAFNICYEDLFGEELLEAIRGPAGASVLVNVSNIAWFGDSQALPQHLEIARMRTLETGRPMLRATNTGVTAAIDHRGRVLAQLPHYTVGVLDVTVQGTTGLTAYARLGNATALGLCVALLGLAWYAGRGRVTPMTLK